MIISPPFLPPRGASQSEDAWLDLAMASPPSRLSDTRAPEGSFPLSHNLNWHNGMHLQAPTTAGISIAVRAIADGKVVFASEPSKPNDSGNDPQNYNPFDRAGVKTVAWTDNGCVILEHRTTIGAANAVETEVVFYSLYMHLSELAKIVPAGQQVKRPLKAGDPIWRKDEVGLPGQIYGHAGQIHFEICLNESNLQHLIGRAPNWVEPALAPAILPAPTADGRTDAIFGSLYFYLSASTPTEATPPAHHLRRTATSGATTLGAPLWVRMTYERGACSFESYDERGARVGARPADAEAEYQMYAEATRRHASLPEDERAHSSPSGWYELLRFGRNIGRGPADGDKDPLPATVAHWRCIPGPTGAAIWADLNAAGSFKFSDADFLPVMGWNCISDDTSPNDQRCDSANLKRLICDLDAENKGGRESEQLARQLGDPKIQRRLDHLFCKFPCEWDRGTIEARYGFVKELPSFKHAPDAWPKLEAHLKTVSAIGLPAGYLAADWYGHPKMFIAQMRQCKWLSADQFKQLMPMEVLRKTSAGLLWERVSATSVTGNMATSQRVPLNVMMRKHLISATAERMASFFGNALQETQWLTKLHEGNKTERYAPWDGRGFLQLTWPSNYLDYWSYRGRDRLISKSVRDVLVRAEAEANRSRSNSALIEADRTLPVAIGTWRLDVEGDEQSPERYIAPPDSAGFYWAKLRMAMYADEPHHLERVGAGTKAYYRSPSFWKASACVNLPGAVSRQYSSILNGFEARCVPYSIAMAILGEASFYKENSDEVYFFPEGILPRR